MYEPIRTPSVHTMADPARTEGLLPRRSREEELDNRLAGHLTALLTVTDELRAHTPDTELDEAARRLDAQVTRLCAGRAPLRAEPSAAGADASRVAALHQRAHTLAGQALVVATSRSDAAAATLAAERLEAHARELGLAGVG
ncbi:hypothetical protein IQ279_12400 [Streptomyces verrucosisporus]|uniref:SCO4983 family protein n=1 Tax=Streptomyces verrucosisporus TaxID=1695161 RepID=UPI0019D11B21|nr:hypothetical protein [Streptomyces verrucosisporus]MBN3930424.1 hypothetical protein [Streptomyces verrucosisporus]